MHIEETILLGTVSSVIASLVFYLWMILIKPRFDVSSKISVTDVAPNTVRCKVKVVNRTRAILTNVTYSFAYCIEGRDGIKDYNVIKPAKEPLTFIKQYQKHDTDYAVRLSFDLDKSKYPLNDNVTLIFTFQASHSFSNSVRIKRVSYRLNDMVDGLFETGLSTNILQRNR